jgi:hypothetical protein
MKKVLAFFALVSILISAGYSYAQTGVKKPVVSRDAFWLVKLGSNLNLIKKREKGVLQSSSDSELIYKSKFLGIAGDITYTFENDSLVKKEFDIPWQEADLTNVLQNINKIESFLQKNTKDLSPNVKAGTKLFEFNNIDYVWLTMTLDNRGSLSHCAHLTGKAK